MKEWPAFPGWGAAYAAIGAMMFGSSYVATAFALRELDAISVAAWRGLLASALLGLVVWRSSQLRLRTAEVRPGGWTRLVVVSLLGGPIFVLAMTIAVEHSGAATSSFVAGLYAVIAAVIAPLVLTERLTWYGLLGLLAGFGGAGLLALSGNELSSPIGIGAAISAAFAYGLYLVLCRRWVVAFGLSGATIVMGSLTFTALLLLAFSAISDRSTMVPTDVSTEWLLAMSWLVVGPSVMAQLFILGSLRLLEASRASPYLLFNPPTAAFLAWLLLGEIFTVLRLAGMGLIFFGIALATLSKVITASRHESYVHPREPTRPDRDPPAGE